MPVGQDGLHRELSGLAAPRVRREARTDARSGRLLRAVAGQVALDVCRQHLGDRLQSGGLVVAPVAADATSSSRVARCGKPRSRDRAVSRSSCLAIELSGDRAVSRSSWQKIRRTHPHPGCARGRSAGVEPRRVSSRAEERVSRLEEPPPRSALKASRGSERAGRASSLEDPASRRGSGSPVRAWTLALSNRQHWTNWIGAFLRLVRRSGRLRR